MQNDVNIFPAIITKLYGSDYNVKSPDFDEKIIYGEDLENAYVMVEDSLKLWLFNKFSENKKIKEPTKVETSKLESNQATILVKVNKVGIVTLK